MSKTAQNQFMGTYLSKTVQNVFLATYLSKTAPNLLKDFDGYIEKVSNSVFWYQMLCGCNELDY